MIGVPERTWRRHQARDGAHVKGPWPPLVREQVTDAARGHALAHPAWGHRQVWAMGRHDGHHVSQATVLRLLRDEGLLLEAAHQRERRELAGRIRFRIPRLPVGPLAPTVLEECRRWFAAKGYSPGSAAAAVNLARRLNAWMEEVGATVGEIDDEQLARFVTVERSRELPCSSLKSWIGALRRFLTDSGYLRAAPDPQPFPPENPPTT